MFILILFLIYINIINIVSTIDTLWKHSLLVLSYWKVSPFLLIISPEDRDYTDLRRIKPNSRNLLIGEQPNPSKILHPEDRLSRHRNYSYFFIIGLDHIFIQLLEYNRISSGCWRVFVEGYYTIIDSYNLRYKTCLLIAQSFELFYFK